tara:strand:+ start:329 stop:1051 length:723 start_codon:yes stop_codon:yes gene_type:complete
MSAILKKLKNDKEYYHGVGKEYVSNSDISTLLSNPKLFGVSRPDNLNFAKGRLFHQALLEPSKEFETLIVDASSRNTKKYKEALSEEHPFAMLTKEVEEVKAMITAAEENFDFYTCIIGTEHEVPAIGELFGVPFKGKADMVGEFDIYDLKTTRNIHEFKWSARKYNYDSQAYIYQELFGKPMTFLCVCKETLQTASFTCSENFVDGGREKVERACEVYRRFFGDNPSEDIGSYYLKEVL